MNRNLSLIVAMDLNNTIGYKGTLPWNIPEDLSLFKNITTNSIVIMGRKTFNSINKPLPNRVNIVLSKENNIDINGVFVFKTIDEIYSFIDSNYSDKKIFIIGGESIYNLFLNDITEFHISVINKKFIGDTFFPNINLENFYVNNTKSFKDFSYTHYIKNKK